MDEDNPATSQRSPSTSKGEDSPATSQCSPSTSKGEDEASVMGRVPKREAEKLASSDPDDDDEGKQVVEYDGYVTFENGCNVDGSRLEATISVDNATNKITVSMKKPASVFVAPGYPIVIEGPLSEEERPKAVSSRGAMMPEKKKAKDLFF